MPLIAVAVAAALVGAGGGFLLSDGIKKTLNVIVIGGVAYYLVKGRV